MAEINEGRRVRRSAHKSQTNPVKTSPLLPKDGLPSTVAQIQIDTAIPRFHRPLQLLLMIGAKNKAIVKGGHGIVQRRVQDLVGPQVAIRREAVAAGLSVGALHELILG